MGFNYLNGKKWADITRDERFFCAHLYFEMQKDLKPFLNLLVTKNIISANEISPMNWGLPLKFASTGTLSLV